MQKLKKKTVLFFTALRFYIYNHCITQVPSFKLRRWYLNRILGYSIHASAFVHQGCFVTGKYISIGKNSVVNRKCTLDGRSGITIGDNVSISPECYLVSLSHDVQSPTFSGKGGVILIGNRCWLGLRAVVLNGVIMEEGSVLAAGSVLTKNAKAFTVYGGVPSKAITERQTELKYSLSWRTFFDTDIPNYK